MIDIHFYYNNRVQATGKAPAPLETLWHYRTHGSTWSVSLCVVCVIMAGPRHLLTIVFAIFVQLNHTEKVYLCSIL